LHTKDTLSIKLLIVKCKRIESKRIEQNIHQMCSRLLGTELI